MYRYCLCVLHPGCTHDRKLNYCRLYWYSGLLWCQFNLEHVLPGQTVIIGMKSYPLRNIWKAIVQDINPTLPVSFLIIKTQCCYIILPALLKSQGQGYSLLSHSFQHPLVFNQHWGHKIHSLRSHYSVGLWHYSNVLNCYCLCMFY